MKNLDQYIKEGLKVNSKFKIREYNYFPKTKKELYELIKQLINERGNEADLNDIDTSKVTNMSGLFMNSSFNGNISMWNVSNVTNMKWMFANSNFNGDISKWDVSKVDDMSDMFSSSKFNGDISKWDVSNVTNMNCMFYGSKFTGENGNISNWNVSNVTNMTSMFYHSPLEKNPPKWYKNI